jgi:hypothetical protein
MANLEWLQSGELFEGETADVSLTLPHEGPLRGLPLGVGAVEYDLGAETKTDSCCSADVVLA